MWRSTRRPRARRSRSRSRDLLAAAAILAAGCSSTPSSTPPPTPSPTPTATPAPLAFEASRALEHVRVLSVDIGERSAGTPGDARAAAHIAEAMGASGFGVTFQRFPLPQGGESTNVIGRPRDLDPGRPYLLVGGHYDTLDGPGANDNASGIGVLLELARIVQTYPDVPPVVFVAFGAEERQPSADREHHVGSLAYVEAMSDEDRAALVAMFNLDMIGRGDGLIAGRMEIGPTTATERLVAVGGELGVAIRERVTPDWSDNGSFLREGMDAGWLWSGSDPCCLHTPRDTFDRVQADALDRAGRVLLETLRTYG